MAWTIDWSTVADTDADWASVDNVQDLQKAVNERSNALGNGDAIAPLKAAGDDVQDHAWMEELQAWVEAQLGNFVRSHDAGGAARGVGYFDGEATDPASDVYSDLQDVFDRAGLATYTWRAYDTHPDDGGADQGRQIQPGDIIGPWLFEDLQAVLNVLVWTAASVSWTASDEDNDKESGGEDSTWAGAKTAAETNWASSPFLSSIDASPFGITEGVNRTGADPRAYEHRRYAYGQADADTSCLRAVEWYGYITTPAVGLPDTTEWDAYGDGHTEDRWTLWQTDTPDPANATETSSSALGHIDSNPTDDGSWCSQPGSDEWVQRGWEATDRCALVRWNVTGGFDYT